jgi:hypothetical protein
MKTVLILFGFSILLNQEADAQTKSKRIPSKNNSITKKPALKQNLSSNTSYPAKGPAIPTSTLGWRNAPLYNTQSVNDPIVRRLNERFYGTGNNIDFRKFMGIGRGTYGFKHGHITLKPNGSTTSGGITGSGSVGTGSSLGNVGVHGAAVGVNGKNPYAGPGMWGTTGTGIGTNFRMNDSSNRSIRQIKD